MRPPDPVTILDCGHVALRDGECATLDCPNFVTDVDESWLYTLPEQYQTSNR